MGKWSFPATAKAACSSLPPRALIVTSLCLPSREDVVRADRADLADRPPAVVLLLMVAPVDLRPADLAQAAHLLTVALELVARLPVVDPDPVKAEADRLQNR
jgi:hypothetical protein